MAQVPDFDTSISNEEILDVKRSLREIVSYFQAKSLDTALEDESAVFVPVRSQIESFKTDNRSFHDTLESYNEFTLDNVKAGNDVNNIESFSQINEVKGNLPITPEIFEETKRETNFYVKAMAKQSGNSETTLEANNTTGASNRFNVASVNQISQQQESAPGNIETLATGKYKGSLKDYIVKECIPCADRMFDLNMDPISDLLSLIQQDIDRMGLYLNGLESLLFNDEITRDICSLLGFLDDQCIPDLASLIALLTLLGLKYKDVMRFSGLSLADLISPIFSPILGGLAGLLDKYIRMIMAPIDCVSSELDRILAKLDVEQGVRDSRTLILADHQNRVRELRSRKEFLESEAIKLQIENRELRKRSDVNSEKILRNEQRIETLGVLPDGSVRANSPVDQVNKEIASEEQAIKELLGDIRKVNSSPTTLKEYRNKIEDTRDAIGSGLRFLRDKTLQGRSWVNAQLDVVLQEIKKFNILKSEVGYSQLENARNLQRIARVIGLIKFLINLHSKGSKLCSSSNDPSLTIGSYLRNINSSNPTLSGFDNSPAPTLVTGNLGGEPKLITYPSDAILQLTGESGTTTVDPEEVKKFNSSGVLPNIGSLANVEITAIIPQTQTQVKPIVTPLDICGKGTDPASKQKIKSWINELS